MSSIPYPLDPMGSTNRGSYFELVVKPGILDSGLTYGFTPYWNAGGYCKVVDWGDGSNGDAITSGVWIMHAYTVAGTYTIRIKADCYRIQFGVSPYDTLLYDANGDWDALGNITIGDSMFSGCINAVFNFSELPKGLTSAYNMFNSCRSATLPLTSLPAGLTDGSYMFQGCTNAKLPLTSLPDGLTDGQAMFSSCSNATLPFTSLPSGLINGSEMFDSCRNATLPLTSLPDGISRGHYMFNGCRNATLPLTSLPSGLTGGSYMFNDCHNATLPLTSLPSGLTDSSYMFYSCKKAVINLDELTANAPEGGWTNITDIEMMFYNAGLGNSPGTVTGSRSAFLAKLPNVTNTTYAFDGTNTTE